MKKGFFGARRLLNKEPPVEVPKKSGFSFGGTMKMKKPEPEPEPEPVKPKPLFSFGGTMKMKKPEPEPEPGRA